MSDLKIRHVAIDTYKENIAYLHRKCEVYHSEGFQALTKIELHAAGRPPVIAVLNIVDDEAITAPGQLGLSEQVFRQLDLPEGSPIRISQAQPAASLRGVHRKIAGERLSLEEYRAIARDIVEHRYSRIEMAAFLVGCAEAGMEREEVLYLTRAMVETGERLDWGERLVADKHCIGGIPGNRTTMIILPIVAAHGMLMPKTSSRAITSPAGTADTMEVIADVELTPGALKEIVRRHRGCLAWGGTARLAPVDDILISVERPLAMDTPGQMVSSILAKKLAAGATHLLIDIPMGPTAKVRDSAAAMQLRKLFEFVGGRLGLQVDVMITNGAQPVGRGIGPLLEVRDVMQVLRTEPEAPVDLREKALQLAGRILEFDPDVRGGDGYPMARDILDSGRALEKMEAIITAQGKRETMPVLGPLCYQVRACAGGRVTGIDNLQLARIASLAGAPKDKGAGVDLHVKLDDRVAAGDPLYSIYAAFKADFGFAKEAAAGDLGYAIDGVLQVAGS